MVTFVWWEAPISMRVEWRCASMTSGGQCVMIYGTTLMLPWSAISWDMHLLEVSYLAATFMITCDVVIILSLQISGHSAMPISVLEVDQFSWMMSSAAQVPTSY